MRRLLNKPLPITHALAFVLTSVTGILTYEHAEAQQPSVTYISEKHYAPITATCDLQSYDIEVDTNNFVHFANSAGVYRFNGVQLKQLSIAAQIDRELVVGLYKDYRQRLWVKAFKAGLGRVAGDSVVAYPYNNRIKPFFHKRFDEVYEDSLSTLHLAVSGMGYYTVSKEGNLDTIIGRSSGLHGFIVAQLPDGKTIHFSVKQKGAANLKTGHLYHLNATGKLDTLCSLTMPSFQYESTLTTDAEGRWYLSTGGHEIFHGVNDSLGVKQAHPSVVIKLFCDSKNTLWIGTLNGLYYAPDGIYDQAQKVLEKSAVAVTAEDALGGLWAKSNAHCFIHIPNQGLYCYSQEEGALHNDRIQFIAFDASRVYALLSNGEIAVLERDTIRYIPLPHTANRLFRDTLNDRLYASANGGPVSFWNSEAWQAVQGRELMRSGIINYDLAHDSTLRVATKHEILRIVQGKLELVYRGRGMIGEISSFCTAPEGSIWIGGTKGLWLWDGKALTQPYTALENAEYLQSDIREVVHLRDKIIVETVRNGMFVVQGECITPILDTNGEAIRLTSIITTGASTLWGIPHNKWARIANIEFDDGGHHVSEYVYSDYVGFLGGVRQQLAIMGDRIYRGSSNGLFVTGRHTLKDIGPAPSTHISEVYVNHRRFAHQQANRLAFDRNTLAFTFDANNYRFAFPKIRCQLVGLDSDWVHPPHNSIQYTNLSPGDYAFQVQARHREEPWGNVEEVRFHIETPFWQTWWFYTLCVLAGILVIGSAVSWWYRSKQARLTQEVDRLKAEQKALQSQMNPHFVYNALNSAQKFLMLGKTQELDDFMGRLAQLMRAGLENSRVAFIPLKEEMEFIHNYLRIETQRFPERFQFNIEIEPQLEEALGDAYIPPLMIQPLCENAIKHAYADQQVTISVTVAFAGETAIEVQVMDDGIGLQTREKRASQHASSLGVSILSERIELLKKQGLEASFDVAPRTTRGTVATLILPTQ